MMIGIFLSKAARLVIAFYFCPPMAQSDLFAHLHTSVKAPTPMDSWAKATVSLVVLLSLP
jgi:hypothetical protein